MINKDQFYSFYRPYLQIVFQTISSGGISIFVGINASGKSIFTEQILSKKFRQEHIKKQNIHLVPLIFKDKPPPTTNQLYKYWLVETAKSIERKLILNEEINEFAFNTQMSKWIKSLGENEKIAFVLLDAQNILGLPESFFTTLTYLYIYSYGKISFIFLSEPYILEHLNEWFSAFTQRFAKSTYIFLKNFDKQTTLADIDRQSHLLHTDFSKYKSLILRYSKGLHGVIRTFCFLLRDNPQVTNIKQLMKIAYNDKLCKVWVEEVLASLPIQSLQILKEVTADKNRFKKYRKSLYTFWLIELGFIKKNGALRYPLMLPYLNQYSPKLFKQAIPLKISKNRIYLYGSETIIPKNESVVLQTLYKFKSKLVTYDQIGETLWGKNQDKFSLWAIARIIARLRKRLASHSINPQIIKSYRGQGYILY